MGLISPKKGKLLIDNNNVFAIDSSSNWTSNIAHVPQNIFQKKVLLKRILLLERNL